MRHFGISRSALVGVLVRPPWSGGEASPWEASVIDPLRQLEAMADLRDRGFLTPEEFDQQKAKVLQG